MGRDAFRPPAPPPPAPPAPNKARAPALRRGPRFVRRGGVRGGTGRPESQTHPLTPRRRRPCREGHPVPERRGRTREEVDLIITWLTGYDRAGIERQIERGVDYETLFAEAPRMNPDRFLITGKVCGVDVAALTDPVERDARYLDKLIDELARGRAMERILRSGQGA